MSPLPAPFELREPFALRVLQEDPDSRVEQIDSPDGRVVRKWYRTPRWLRWRSFGVRSRGGREFANLARIRAAGVPCVRPIAWGEHRRWGCVAVSYLVTEYLGEAPSLERALGALAVGGDTRSKCRRRLLQCYGSIVGALHRGGMASTTLQPRNVLVEGEVANGALRLCDQPVLLACRGSIVGGRLAQVDVYDMAFSARRRSSCTRAERMRLLLAYADGDRRLARRLWRALAGRPRALHHLQKELTRALARLLPVSVQAG